MEKDILTIHQKLVRKACDIAQESIKNGNGPFGALIADKDGNIIAQGNNMVVAMNDPTMHAQVSAIRTAAKITNNYLLEGLTIYCSCEPCPMCFGAILWSQIKQVYYGNDAKFAQSVGIDDPKFYQRICGKQIQRKHIGTQLQKQYAKKHLLFWKQQANKPRFI